MSLPFLEQIFSFTNFLCNQAAHVIAKEALKRNSIGIWVEECPPFLLNSVQIDKYMGT